MSNSYFQFKHFTIHQERCAMKVCTDACILGAWLSARVTADAQMLAGARVLDIGSGTGLLMLMIAQRHAGNIEGIELDPDAFGQLKENLAASPWAARLKAFGGDVRDFIFGGRFDLIVTNPPFFEDDLPADSMAKNLARHSHALKLSELIDTLDRNLEPAAGEFGILLPPHREEYFETLATGRGFHLLDRVNIRHRPGDDPFRIILLFSRKDQGIMPSEDLVIRKEDGTYTAAFVELLKDYYLYL